MQQEEAIRSPSTFAKPQDQRPLQASGGLSWSYLRFFAGKMLRTRSKNSSGFFSPHEYFFADWMSSCKVKRPPTSFTKFAMNFWLWPAIKFPPLAGSPQPHLQLPIYSPFIEPDLKSSCISRIWFVGMFTPNALRDIQLYQGFW